MKNHFVSIIIPTYKDWPRLELCLNALKKQSYPQDHFEILVINNAPIEDPLPKKIQLAKNCRLLIEKLPGSYAARNKGLNECKGEIIGFTDSDCIPDLLWIENAVNFFNKFPKYQRMGGGIRIFSKNKLPSFVEWYDYIFAFPQEAYVRSGNAVTANMFAYKEVFRNVGFFNDKLMSGGDYQWGKLANKNGYKIGYAPESFVNHPARSTVSELVKKAKRVGEGQAMFNTTNRGSKYNRSLAYLKLVKPRFWEIKKIFAYYSDGINFLDKFFVVLLRHYITATGDYAKLKYENKK
ncbi:glycosyl transferase family 2 [Gillisia mitskevichiae]|uniref:Glycosyl transferase family 2 n=1 Tax=Gillisia mitskevichiae TaxID=270921 RepID=A0A495PWL1_9FLAO|nr:glycosyltransferase [Gillisia mitskevichiae]RKS53952.1 glycosyl transferase family 2 [Gillisia mitskevichiae]